MGRAQNGQFCGPGVIAPILHHDERDDEQHTKGSEKPEAKALELDLLPIGRVEHAESNGCACVRVPSLSAHLAAKACLSSNAAARVSRSQST